jgi:hypothetical protein
MVVQATARQIGHQAPATADDQTHPLGDGLHCQVPTLADSHLVTDSTREVRHAFFEL